MHFTAQDIGLLRAGAWFAGLPQSLQDLILANCELRSYRKDEVILREGEPGRGMGAVLEGQVHLTRSIGNRADALVDVGHPGIWFGVYGAVSGGRPSIGGLVAASPVRAAFLPLAAFDRIVADEPRYFRAFASVLMQRYAQMFRYLAEAKGLVPEERLRSRLLELARTRSAAGTGVHAVDIAVSQAELAKLVGLSRQSTSSLLARLERRGLIEIGFRSIRVLV
jgi:CRP-like cAMP-binding protein